MSNLDQWLIGFGIFLLMMNGLLFAIAAKRESIETLLRIKILGRDS